MISLDLVLFSKYKIQKKPCKAATSHLIKTHTFYRKYIRVSFYLVPYYEGFHCSPFYRQYRTSLFHKNIFGGPETPLFIQFQYSNYIETLAQPSTR